MPLPDPLTETASVFVQPRARFGGPLVYLQTMPQIQLNDLGHILEGVIERDPMTERLQLHTVDHQGKATTIDILDLLEGYENQEVRLVLTSMESIRKVEEMLGDQEGVLGVMPEDVPGAQVRRTSKPE